MRLTGLALVPPVYYPLAVLRCLFLHAPFTTAYSNSGYWDALALLCPPITASDT